MIECPDCSGEAVMKDGAYVCLNMGCEAFGKVVATPSTYARGFAHELNREEQLDELINELESLGGPERESASVSRRRRVVRETRNTSWLISACFWRPRSLRLRGRGLDGLALRGAPMCLRWRNAQRNQRPVLPPLEPLSDEACDRMAMDLAFRKALTDWERENESTDEGSQARFDAAERAIIRAIAAHLPKEAK